MKRGWGVILACWFTVMVGGTARAQELIAGDCAPLFTPAYGQCAQGDLEHIFSGYVCQYETIVADVFSQLYCSVQEMSVEPLYALLTLFVVILGAAILTQAIPFTKKDMMEALLRIGLLAAFASHADFLIGIIYNGVMGFIIQGVDVVMSIDSGGTGITSATAVYDRIDQLINQMIGGGALADQTGEAGENNCRDSVIPILITLMFTMPPVFLIGIATVLRMLMVFLRTIVGYLYAITVIMFLVVLAPIFLGAGLFKATRHLFKKWVEYLMSYAVQVVVVFAFVGFVFALGVEEDMRKLLNLPVPYSNNQWQADVRVNFNNFCTFPSGFGADYSITDGTPIPPTGLTANLGLVRFLSQEVLTLLLFVYLIEAVMNLAPEVAQRLGAVPTAQKVAGNMFDSMAGVQNIQRAGEAFGGGYMRGGGGVPGRTGAGLSAGWNALTGRQ